ncbi:hypothetical protein [Geodermatophilus maliterrae]|uniref:Uncharacterized protein n=1 Tax=Geodermatophilus maliterrae TaxID=3162531 RepID=A0ABV3XJZ6_9ACTN
MSTRDHHSGRLGAIDTLEERAQFATPFDEGPPRLGPRRPLVRVVEEIDVPGA